MEARVKREWEVQSRITVKEVLRKGVGVWGWGSGAIGGEDTRGVGDLNGAGQE